MAKFKDLFDWERTVILELNREHESVCRSHKVNLRPIGITLFDSETHWGEFDNLTRTISISRKLINEHPWHHVVGVFRHEMAHQFVAEHAPARFNHDRPHSEIFKEACKRLGVPDQFAKAGLNLQTCGIDWRSEPRDSATERILDKVKKLLALANSSNEHESLLAMERVRELYAKYNLEIIGETNEKSFVHLVITHGKKRMPATEQRAVSILVEHFFVKVISTHQFDPKTGDHVHAIELIGARENVLMAEYVYHFLLNQADFLLQQAVDGGLRLVRSERSSYRLGVLDGFAKKLKSAERSSPGFDSKVSQSAALTVVGQALAKFREGTDIDDYLSDIYPRLGVRRGSATEIHSHAFAAGHAAGRSITLNKPIASEMGNRGQQISGGRR